MESRALAVSRPGRGQAGPHAGAEACIGRALTNSDVARAVWNSTRPCGCGSLGAGGGAQTPAVSAREDGEPPARPGRRAAAHAWGA